LSQIPEPIGKKMGGAERWEGQKDGRGRKMVGQKDGRAERW
jgi:hypothetical protein